MRFCWHIDGTTCPACRENQVSRTWGKPKTQPFDFSPVTDYATNKDLEDLRREVYELRKIVKELLNKLK